MKVRKKCNTIYSDNKTSRKMKRFQDMIRIMICMTLYVMTGYIQQAFSANGNIAGVLAQLQVMISTYLVVGVKRIGYLIAIGFNLFQCALVSTIFFVNGNKEVLPGMIVPICTMITLSIISFYGGKLQKKLQEETLQKEELFELYEELAATENEVSQQNIQLLNLTQQMKEKEEKLNKLAYIDVLTELPNRRMVIERLDLLINLEADKGTGFAVVFIDLDDFKRINDSKGHNVGDVLLKEVVVRIIEQLHGADLLGRLGGDEFALIIQSKLREEEIYEYVERIRLSISERFLIDQEEFFISASFGIAMYPKDGFDSNELLKNADTAMYRSKANGRNGIHLYDSQMNKELLDRIEFENRLKASLDKNELYLLYQPLYMADSKKLRGFEALARWESPELGSVSPLKFIPVAEEMGYIKPIGLWALRTACKLAKCILERFAIDFILSVNVSLLQFLDPLFVQSVTEILEDEKVQGNYLEFEITETVYMSSIEKATNIVNDLKAIGIRIALDDFGTGYSSLSYLQKLPIDTLKLDKSFIDGIGITIPSRQIVGKVIELVRQMELTVVSEGVENENQLNYLREQKCDIIQGYLWGKPMREKEVCDLIKNLEIASE